MFSDIIRHMPARGLLALSAFALLTGEALSVSEFVDALRQHDFSFMMFCESSSTLCRDFLETWEDLAEAYDEDPSVHIGHVDCNEQAELCQGLGVAELPSFRYFLPHDHEGTIYDGERSFNALFSFVQALSHDTCVVSRHERCTKEQKAAIEPYMSMPIAKLRSKTMERRMLAQERRDDMRQKERLLLDFERTGSEKRSTSSKAFKKHVEELESAFYSAQEAVIQAEREQGAEYRAMRAVELFRDPAAEPKTRGKPPRRRTDHSTRASDASSAVGSAAAAAQPRAKSIAKDEV